MADPLTDTVNTFTPAPLGIFDRNAAESITSKYANTRRGLAAGEAAIKAAGSAYDLGMTRERDQWTRERAERERLLADRETKEYEEKLANRQDRVGFLKDLMKFDRTAPDASTKLTEVMKGIAETSPALLEDPVTKDVLRAVSEDIDDELAIRKQAEGIKLREESQANLLKERAKYHDTLRYIPAEEWAKIPRDENGQYDMVTAGALGMQYKLKAQEEADVGKVERRKQATFDILDRKNVTEDQKARIKDLEEVTMTDLEAFPSRKENVIQQAIAAGVAFEDLPKDDKWGPELKKAEAWDKKKFENETRVAREYANPEDYVNLMEGLTPAAKASRRALWEAANEGKAAPVAPAKGVPDWAKGASDFRETANGRFIKTKDGWEKIVEE